MSIRKQATGAAAWVTVGYGFEQVLRLATNLIMTRLLVPDAFGIMAVVTGITLGLAMIADFGVGASIVQSKRGDDQAFLNTAWSLQIGRGFLIWLLGLAIAGLIYQLANLNLTMPGSVYADPLLPLVISVATISPAIQGFESVNIHLAIRNLQQRRLAFLTIASQLFAIVVMLMWAVQDASIWALVAGGVAGTAFKSVVSHMVLQGQPCRPGWDVKSALELFHFGKWLMLSSILGFVARRGDRLIMGTFLTPRELGVFAIAALMADAIKVAMDKLFSAVSFPVLSDIARTKRYRFEQSYYRLRRVFDGVLFSIAGIVMVLGDEIVALLFDDRYREAGWMLQILGLSIALRAFHQMNAAFLALKMGKTLASLSAILAISLLVTVPLSYHLFGFQGAVIATSINAVWGLPFSLRAFSNMGFFRIWNELSMLPLLFLTAGIALLIQRFLI